MTPTNSMQPTQPASYQVELERTANQPIAEGIHLFVVKTGEEAESKTGNPMWVFTLACLTPGEEGKEVRIYLVLIPAARWKFELFLDAMMAPKTGTAVINQFFGRQLRAQVTHEDYEGRPQARIGEMFPVSSAAARPAIPNPAVKKVSTSPAAAVAAPSAPVAKAVVPKKASKGLPADATQ